MSEDFDMVERVAKAIWNSQQPPGAPPYHHLNSVEKFQVSLIARDCIKAMREPTVEMATSGNFADGGATVDSSEVWQAMIDAALEEN